MRPVPHIKNAISIHSLPKEGDASRYSASLWQSNFNPLPPQRGRQRLKRNLIPEKQISIHSLPKEGDVFQVAERGLARKISIHSHPKEGD